MNQTSESNRPNSVSIRQAIRELYFLVDAVANEPDPAPWFEVTPFSIEMFSDGDEGAYVRRQKISQRSKLLMQRALLRGQLRPHYSDGFEARDVPAWAWVGAEQGENVWFFGRLALDPLLPDDWRRWSGHAVFIDREQLSDWMQELQRESFAASPELPAPFDEAERPPRITVREPSAQPFVSLSEALSWIAFGIALDSGRLTEAIDCSALHEVETQLKLEQAVATFATIATGGGIAVRGKYKTSDTLEDAQALTEAIDPVRFHDFAQFDVLTDSLRYGVGLTWYKSNAVSQLITSKRRDLIKAVTVNRADLLTNFPPISDAARPFMTPLPAFLSGVGTVIAMEEALCRTAFGTASYDISVWQSSDGSLAFKDPFGCVLSADPDGDGPAHIAALRLAHTSLHAAVRDGALATYVAPDGATAITIPRFYWSQVDPEFLDVVYRGLSNEDPAAGNILILSREAFSTWLADRTEGTSGDYNGGRAAAYKGGRPPSDAAILEKADEMKSRGLDGRTIAKTMRLESGFENVATTAVRELIRGRWKPNGRPRKGA